MILEQVSLETKKRGRPRKVVETTQILEDENTDNVYEKNLNTSIMNNDLPLNIDSESDSEENIKPIRFNKYEPQIDDEVIVNYTFISRLSKLTGKTEDYIKTKFLGITDLSNVVDRIISCIEESCLPTHRFSVGDYVWIPEEVADNTRNGFGKIELVYCRKPKKVLVNRIIYTNKICYAFSGFKNLIVQESYCFLSQTECQEACDALNNNR